MSPWLLTLLVTSQGFPAWAAASSRTQLLLHSCPSGQGQEGALLSATDLAWPWIHCLEPKHQGCLSVLDLGFWLLFFFFLIHKINLYLKSSAAIICGGGNSAHSKALFNINEVISTVTNRQWGGGRCTNATIWLRKANIVTIIFSREQLPYNTSCFSDASSTGKRKNACIWHRSGRKPEFLLYRNFQYLKCFNCKWKWWVFPGNQDSWGFQDSEFAKYPASSQIISFSARQNQFHYH